MPQTRQFLHPTQQLVKKALQHIHEISFFLLAAGGALNSKDFTKRRYGILDSEETSLYIQHHLLSYISGSGDKWITTH